MQQHLIASKCCTFYLANPQSPTYNARIFIPEVSGTQQPSHNARNFYTLLIQYLLHIETNKQSINETERRVSPFPLNELSLTQSHIESSSVSLCYNLVLWQLIVRAVMRICAHSDWSGSVTVVRVSDDIRTSELMRCFSRTLFLLLSFSACSIIFALVNLVIILSIILSPFQKDGRL